MSIAEFLRDAPLLKKFSEAERQQFAEMKHAVLTFEKGDLIIKEGEQTRSLYLLISGSCLITKTEDGANIRLAKVSAGEVFGEMSCFSETPRKSNVVANEKVMALKMDDDFFQKVPAELGSKIKDFLIELLVSRLDSMNAAIMRISKLMRN